MRILVAGDLHFNKVHFQWLAEQQGHYDCLCLTGDFVDGHLDGFEQQTQWIAAWFEALIKQTFICSGNHDLDDVAECRWLDELENPLVCRDNQLRRFQGLTFGCMPYLGADLAAFFDCDILLTHVPPSDTACSRSMDSGHLQDWGDRALHDALQHQVITPCYLLCGHVEAPVGNRDVVHGVEVINPGASHAATVPNHQIVTVGD